MFNTSYDFIWASDTEGYHIPGNVNLNARDTILDGKRIVRNGGMLQRYQPASIPTILDRFLSVHTPADMLNFAKRYGPLTQSGFYCAASEDDFLGPDQLSWQSEEGEPLDLGLGHAGWFRDVLQRKGKPNQVARTFDKLRLEKYQVRIEADKKSGIKLRYFPEDLLDFLILNLAHVVLALPTYSRCLMCGEFFKKGVGTNRRVDAQFCTDQHRIDFNSQKRTIR
jgi:hypothetical protein